MPHPTPPSKPTNRKVLQWVVWAMAVDLFALGLWIVLSAHMPPRMTRFGWAAALLGPQAQWFGVSTMLLGGFPLLLLANKETVTRWGVALALAFMVSLGLAIYGG